MQKKAFTLINKGMNRDLSISKAGQSSAYTNKNIRIIARDHDTLLSVTNERGTKQISLGASITGTLIGWGILNEHVILFTTNGSGTDKIYRIDYTGDSFVMRVGRGTTSDPYVNNVPLFSGNLGFSLDNPIETIVYFETEDIQKVYWLDGLHVLRMLNFMADSSERAMWTANGDYTFFDSNRWTNSELHVEITKDNSGNVRPNGVIQYLITYYNEHGQETAYAWISDLVYLSPSGIGGSADGTNNNKITLKISDWDKRFTHFRVYSLFRSSYNGTPVAMMVAENATDYSQSYITVVDDYAHQSAIDPTTLLYLGSRSAFFDTMAHKDGTLFLGGIAYENRGDALTEFGELIKSEMINHGSSFVPGEDWEASCIEFDYSSSVDSDIQDIEYNADRTAYSDNWQLGQSSSAIASFKGGEKYRFGLVFRDKNGNVSDVFWIGDSENGRYPVIASGCIKRVIVRCTIPASVVSAARNLNFVTAQLVIAEATYADRSVKAQGILNPTVFNVWSRYQNRLYSMPSWISRPRNIGVPSRHFSPIGNANTSIGEIECNFWEGDTPTPYFYVDGYNTSNPEYSPIENQESIFDYLKIVYEIKAYLPSVSGLIKYQGRVICAKCRSNGILGFNYQFSSDEKGLAAITEAMMMAPDTYTLVLDSGANIGITSSETMEGNGTNDSSRKDLFTKLQSFLVSSCNIDGGLGADLNMFEEMCEYAKSHKKKFYCWNSLADNGSTDVQLTVVSAFDSDSWIHVGSASGAVEPGKNTESSGAYAMSYYKKQFMFLDENTITIDSPELAYEKNLFDLADGYKIRVVGMASADSCISDSSLDATHGKLAGRNFVNDRYSGTEDNSNLNGVLSWPMWQEYELRENKDVDVPAEIINRTEEHYTKGGAMVRYWLHAWSRAGIIDGWSDPDQIVFDESHYGFLKHKVFANLRYSYNTVYNQNVVTEWTSDLQSLRVFNYTSSQYVRINVGDETKYYDGVVNDVMAPPNNVKYPILYSKVTSNSDSETPDSDKKLYTNAPIPITFASNPHAVFTLPTSEITVGSKNYYKQVVLPKVSGDETTDDIPQASENRTGALLPWLAENDNEVRYINWAHDLPDDFIIDYWDEEENVVSLRREMESYGQPSTPDDYDDWFVYHCWQSAISDYTGVPLYCRIKAHPSDSQSYVWFLVDISHYSIYHPDADLGDHDTLRVTMANVKAFVAQGGNEKYQNIKWTYYSDSGEKTEHGNYSLAVAAGTLSDISNLYQYVDYMLERDTFSPSINSSATAIRAGSPYYLIGEIYYDYGVGAADNRYGGITDAAIKSNRFVFAGPEYRLGEPNAATVIYGNQGDTYFQRWNNLRIKPHSSDDVNQMIDIVSFMVETHINLDGNYDLQKMTRYLSSIDYEKYGQINEVYSQRNNFITNRDLGVDFDLDLYKSSLTWTLEKHDAAETDEWMHITLASNLKLDGERGNCNALRRFQNSIIAFQDRSISEILFNSRTQIPTGDGVPIEIANSGKVDGKRVITNNSGCINKWSIVEGKNALYYVDNINKAFYAFNGNLENLSEKLGFTAWFKEKNKMQSWKPGSPFNNFVSYFDRVHSDVYLVGGWDTNEPCLVYNETLGVFTSFFDYANVPMMTNVGDEFISFYGSSLYRQNRGKYNYFFNAYKPFSVMYRVTPDPFGDKIWSNIEYRADFYDVNPTGSGSGSGEILEEGLIDGGAGDYKKDSTFDAIKVWNEYQTTGTFTGTEDKFNNGRIDKRFRIWRCQIPRAYGSQYGLDRIRNPWVNVEFKKVVPENTAQYGEELMQLHDATIIYYE